MGSQKRRKVSINGEKPKRRRFSLMGSGFASELFSFEFIARK